MNELIDSRNKHPGYGKIRLTDQPLVQEDLEVL